MTDSSVFQMLASFFRQIYLLGQSIELYSGNGFSVSLNEFLIALAIISIVLVSLVSVVKYRMSNDYGGIFQLESDWYKDHRKKSLAQKKKDTGS